MCVCVCVCVCDPVSYPEGPAFFNQAVFYNCHRLGRLITTRGAQDRIGQTSTKMGLCTGETG